MLVSLNPEGEWRLSCQEHGKRVDCFDCHSDIHGQFGCGERIKVVAL